MTISVSTSTTMTRRWKLIGLGALTVTLLQGALAQPARAEAPPAPQELNLPNPGQLSSKFRIDDRDPEASVPPPKEQNANPLEFGYLLQDLLERAEQAHKANDLHGVVKYYRAVAKAVPDRAKGWAKLCEAYEAIKEVDKATKACRYAVDREGVELADYVRYVHLILAKEGDLRPDDRTELTKVLEHLSKQNGLELATSHLRCEIGVRLGDVAMLETCTASLAKLAPEDPRTVVFQWSLAMHKGQRQEAERLIERAKSQGVVLSSITRMAEATAALGRPKFRWQFLVAGLLVLAFGGGMLLRRRMLSQRR
ncbi:MAG: hypothetical protein H7Y19_03025 [Luteimonas sp.]|nr:hypothetical protein [Luteimonas sp.]